MHRHPLAKKTLRVDKAPLSLRGPKRRPSLETSKHGTKRKISETPSTGQETRAHSDAPSRNVHEQVGQESTTRTQQEQLSHTPSCAEVTFRRPTNVTQNGCKERHHPNYWGLCGHTHPTEPRGHTHRHPPRDVCRDIACPLETSGALRDRRTDPRHTPISAHSLSVSDGRTTRLGPNLGGRVRPTETERNRVVPGVPAVLVRLPRL